jgi:hypothetical protein
LLIDELLCNLGVSEPITLLVQIKQVWVVASQSNILGILQDVLLGMLTRCFRIGLLFQVFVRV